MRKHIKKIGIGIVICSFAIMSIGSGSTNDTKEIVTTEADSTATDSGSSDISSDTEETEKTPSVTIEEQVLIDDNGLKVTAKEYIDDGIFGNGIKLLVENDSEKTVGLGCKALIVNDYMISDLFSSTVAAGKKANETIDLYNTQLENAGIDNVGKIEIYFYTFDPDTYMTEKEYDCVTIETSAFDQIDTTPNDSGTTLYETDGIKIVGKYVDESSFWGAGVLLYIENNLDKNIIVQCDDMSINGFMVTPYFSANVYSNKKAIDDITILSSDLEDNGIDSVEELELNFKILDENFSTIAESGPVSFSAK